MPVLFLDYEPHPLIAYQTNTAALLQPSSMGTHMRTMPTYTVHTNTDSLSLPIIQRVTEMDPVMNDFDHDDPKFLEAIFRVLLAENQREDDSKDSCVSALPIGKLA